MQINIKLKNKHYFIINFKENFVFRAICFLLLIFCYLILFFSFSYIELEYETPENLPLLYNHNRFFFAFCIFSIINFFILLPYRSLVLYSIEIIVILISLLPNLVLFSFTQSSPKIVITIVFLILFLRILGYLNLFWEYKINLNYDVKPYFIIGLILFIPFFHHFITRIDFDFDIVNGNANAKLAARDNNSNYINYSLYFLTTFFFPLLLLNSLKNKKYIYGIVSVFFFFFLFSGFGARYIIWVLPFILWFYFFNDLRRKVLLLLISYFAFLVIFLLTKNDILLTITQRSIFIPALMNQLYFDFFENNSIYYADSIFKQLINYPYDFPPGEQIREHFYGHGTLNASNGFPSDGFMHIGNYSIIFYPLLLAIFFKYIENLIQQNPYIFGIVLLVYFNIISASFHTCILTFGFWILLVLPLIYQIKKVINGKNRV